MPLQVNPCRRRMRPKPPARGMAPGGTITDRCYNPETGAGLP